MSDARRILVVDDEALIAMMLEDMLTDIGFDVVGPATTVDAAIALIDPGMVDAALVDVNLRGGSSDPIAHVLRARNIPFAFVTGMAERRDDAFADVPMLQKPFHTVEIERTIGSLLAARVAAPGAD